MHALTRFVRDAADARGWQQRDLVAASGLSRQVISTLWNDSRPALVQRPDDSTVQGLADGFGVGVEVVLAKVAEAMGLPTGTVTVYDASGVSNDELLAELGRRLAGGAGNVVPLSPPSGRPSPKITGDKKVADGRVKQRGEFEDD